MRPTTSCAPDGHTAYIMMGDQGALWDVSTGAHLRDLKGEETTSVKKSAFSADGRLLATTGGDKAIRVWDVATGGLVQTLVGHTEIVFQPTFSLDDATLLSESVDGSAKLWDIATGTTLRTFVGHTASVYANALSPDGQFAVTGGKDGTVRFWDIEAPAERDTLSGPSSFMYGLASSPDGKLLFAGNADGTSQLWDVATQAVTQRLESDEQIDSAAFSPDGSLLLTSSGGGSSTLWDPSSGKQIAQLNGSGGGEPMAGFTADGRAAIGPVPPLTDDGVPGVGEWDVATRELIRRFEMDDYSAGAIAPDGSLLFTYRTFLAERTGFFGMPRTGRDCGALSSQAESSTRSSGLMAPPCWQSAVMMLLGSGMRRPVPSCTSCVVIRTSSHHATGGTYSSSWLPRPSCASTAARHDESRQARRATRLVRAGGARGRHYSLRKTATGRVHVASAVDLASVRNRLAFGKTTNSTGVLDRRLVADARAHGGLVRCSRC